MILKIIFLLFMMIWVRASWPRFRYDQLMSFGWKVLLPVAVLNFIITAVFIIALQEAWFNQIASSLIGSFAG